MRSLGLICAVLALSFAPLAAHADSITVSESITSDGSLNGVAFNNQLILISGTADTSNIVVLGSGSTTTYTLILNNPTVKIGSGAAIAFTGTVDAFSQNTLVGINDNPGGNIMDTFSSLPLHNLTSSFSVSGGAINIPGDSFGTASGALTIEDLDPTNSTFTAVVTRSALPEPSSLLLLATGVAGLAFTSRSSSTRHKLRLT